MKNNTPISPVSLTYSNSDQGGIEAVKRPVLILENQETIPQSQTKTSLSNTNNVFYEGDFYEKNGEKVPHGEGFRSTKTSNGIYKKESGSFYDGVLSVGKTEEEQGSQRIEAKGVFDTSEQVTNPYNITSGNVSIFRMGQNPIHLSFESGAIIEKRYRDPGNISQEIIEKGIFSNNDESSNLLHGRTRILHNQKVVAIKDTGTILYQNGKIFLGNINGYGRIIDKNNSIEAEGIFQDGKLISGKKTVINGYQEGTFDEKGNIITGKYIDMNKHIFTWYKDGKITKRLLHVLVDREADGSTTTIEEKGNFTSGKQGEEIFINGTVTKSFINPKTHKKEIISTEEITHIISPGLQTKIQEFEEILAKNKNHIEKHLLRFYQESINIDRQFGIESKDSRRIILIIQQELEHITKLLQLSQEISGNKNINPNLLDNFIILSKRLTETTQHLKQSVFADYHQFLNLLIETSEDIQRNIQQIDMRSH